MIFEKIGVGATYEAAVEDAKRQLNAPEDALLQFETIQEAKKRLFGLKTDPAKVKVWYEVKDKPAAKPAKPAPVQPKPAAPEKKPAAPAEKAPQQKKAQPAEKPAAQQNAKPAQEKKAPQKDKKPAPEKAEPKPAVKAEPENIPEPVYTPLPIDENDASANYLRMIVEGMGIEDAKITLMKEENENEYIYTIDCGKEDGALIGRRGETLDAIQYLLRLSINKGLSDDKHRKVSVNVGNYREKRNDNLRQLAAKNARTVLKYGRNVALEPMNPYERRIIHTAIQQIDGVTSFSTGVDSGRRVIIALEEGVSPTNPSKGGYGKRDGYRGGNRGGGGNRRGGGGGGYRKKEAYQPAVTREPRKDSAGSLYGKIEIPQNNE